MKQRAPIFPRQLALPLNSKELKVPPIPQRQEELINALADLLWEAIGAEVPKAARPEGGSHERKDHV